MYYTPEYSLLKAPWHHLWNIYNIKNESVKFFPLTLFFPFLSFFPFLTTFSDEEKHKHWKWSHTLVMMKHRACVKDMFMVLSCSMIRTMMHIIQCQKYNNYVGRKDQMMQCSWLSSICVDHTKAASYHQLLFISLFIIPTSHDIKLLFL